MGAVVRRRQRGGRILAVVVFVVGEIDPFAPRLVHVITAVILIRGAYTSQDEIPGLGTHPSPVEADFSPPGLEVGRPASARSAEGIAPAAVVLVVDVVEVERAFYLEFLRGEVDVASDRIAELVESGVGVVTSSHQEVPVANHGRLGLGFDVQYPALAFVLADLVPGILVLVLLVGLDRDHLFRTEIVQGGHRRISEK